MQNVPCGTKEQLKLLSLTEFNSHLFSSILLAEPLNQGGGGGGGGEQFSWLFSYFLKDKNV